MKTMLFNFMVFVFAVFDCIVEIHKMQWEWAAGMAFLAIANLIMAVRILTVEEIKQAIQEKGKSV